MMTAMPAYDEASLRPPAHVLLHRDRGTFQGRRAKFEVWSDELVVTSTGLLSMGEALARVPLRGVRSIVGRDAGKPKSWRVVVLEMRDGSVVELHYRGHPGEKLFDMVKRAYVPERDRMNRLWAHYDRELTDMMNESERVRRRHERNRLSHRSRWPGRFDETQPGAWDTYRGRDEAEHRAEQAELEAQLEALVASPGPTPPDMPR